jgi:hypothetical integral membrane protein (TIGR02206 family)
MNEIIALNFTGDPFQIFYPPHLVVIAILILLYLSLIYVRRNASPRFKDIFRHILAVVLLVNELSWHWWNWYVGQWTIQTMLPLHVCSMLVFVSALMLVTKSKRIYEYAYFMGIGAAMQAVLTPDLGIYGFPHYRFFQTFISHGGIILAALFMTVVENYRPYWKSLGRVFMGMNLYMGVVFLINSLIGSNYMFIMRKPDTPSLMDVLGPWPWYLLSLEAIGITICLLLYLPYMIYDWRNRKSALPAVI